MIMPTFLIFGDGHRVIDVNLGFLLLELTCLIMSFIFVVTLCLQTTYTVYIHTNMVTLVTVHDTITLN